MLDFEREEMEAEANARADYLSEAFGDEARSLHAQAIEEEKDYFRSQIALDGFYSEEGWAQAREQRLAKARAMASIHAPVDDCPF